MTSPPPGELDALRQGAAVIAPGRRFLIAATGADVFDWLERICSSPVAGLAPGRATRAVLMDGKGKMRCDLRVLRPPTGDGVLLDLPTGPRATLARVLDMYVIQDKVVLDDRGDTLAFVSLLGPGAGAVLERCGMAVPATDVVASTDDGRLVTPSHLSGTGGFDLLVPADQVEATLAACEEAGAVRIAAPALELVRVEHGVPWFESEMAADVIPLEVLLDDHVSITKGCYPGQEVVARIQNLGQVSRRLVRLACDRVAALQPGDELSGTGDFDGKSAGVITSVVADEAGGRTLALGFARRAFWSDGTVVRSGDTELVISSLG